MANQLYDIARAEFAKGTIDWENDTFKVLLIDTGNYTLSQSHTTLADIAVSSRVGSETGVSLPDTKVETNGALDAEDVTFTAVANTASVEAIIIYRDTGTPSTMYLIAYMDTATGLPITPNGGDIIITWDNGTNRILRL
jgi:hypothetical protein